MGLESNGDLTCTIKAKGEVAQSPVEDPTECRLKAAMKARGFNGLSVEFTATGAGGDVEPSGSGKALSVADPEGSGRKCAAVELKDGNSGLVCTRPLIQPNR